MATLIWGAIAAAALVVGGFVLSGWYNVYATACLKPLSLTPTPNSPLDNSVLARCGEENIARNVGTALWILGILLALAVIAGAVVSRLRARTMLWDGQQWVETPRH